MDNEGKEWDPDVEGEHDGFDEQEEGDEDGSDDVVVCDAVMVLVCVSTNAGIV